MHLSIVKELKNMHPMLPKNLRFSLAGETSHTHFMSHMSRNSMRKALMIATIFIPLQASAITIAGGTDCGRFIENPDMYDQWIAGYLSGMNATLGKEGRSDPLAVIKSSEQSNLWLQNYCQANPLDTLQVAIHHLYAELVSKTKAQHK